MQSEKNLDALWKQNGFLLIERFFSPDEIGALRSRVDEYVSGACSLHKSDAVYDIAKEHCPGNPQVRRIKNPDMLDPVFRGFARHPRIVPVLHGLFGRGVRLEVGKINLKPTGASAGIAWHQDYPFSPLTNDDSVAVGIFIDDVTEENGPLLMIPGSHRRPLVSHHRNGYFVGCTDKDDPALSAADVRQITGPAGSISIHHCRTLHASGPNRSPHPRGIYFNQYHAADAWPYLGVKNLDWWTDRLLSGEETYAPRITMTSVQLPFPVKPYGSIFELQGDAAKDERQFEVS